MIITLEADAPTEVLDHVLRVASQFPNITPKTQVLCQGSFLFVN